MATKAPTTRPPRHKLIIEVAPEIAQALKQEAEERSNLERRFTMSDIVRELLVRHIQPR